MVEASRRDAPDKNPLPRIADARLDMIDSAALVSFPASTAQY